MHHCLQSAPEQLKVHLASASQICSQSPPAQALVHVLPGPQRATHCPLGQRSTQTSSFGHTRPARIAFALRGFGLIARRFPAFRVAHVAPGTQSVTQGAAFLPFLPFLPFAGLGADLATSQLMTQLEPMRHTRVHPPPWQSKEQFAPPWQICVQPPPGQALTHWLPLRHSVSQPPPAQLQLQTLPFSQI